MLTTRQDAAPDGATAISWTRAVATNDHAEAFAVSLRLPDLTGPLPLPPEQRCAGGTTVLWAELPGPMRPHEGRPAPHVVVCAAR